MHNELWRPIPEYEGLYEVSSTGMVRSLGKEYSQSTYGKTQTKISSPKVLSQNYDVYGYLCVTLIKDGKRIHTFTHRLVALAFLDCENPLEMQVNHKNGIKDDNRLENLEWVTPKQNTIHAHTSGLCGVNGRSRQVIGFDENNKLVFAFESARQASIALGKTDEGSLIASVCRKGYGKTSGFHWAYVSYDDYIRYDEALKNNETIYVKNISIPTHMRRSSKGTPVAMMDDDGNIIKTFDNSRKACLELGKSVEISRNIRSVCEKGYGHCAGYRWKYVNQLDTTPHKRAH